MDHLAEVCERVASYSSRTKKIAIVAEYLRSLNEGDLVRAVRFLCANPAAGIPSRVNLFGEEESRKLAVGYAVLRDAGIAVTGWPRDIFRLCHQETGDIGETISLLLPGHTRSEPLSLAEAERRYAALFHAHGPAQKLALLQKYFSTYSPITVKYFVKVITGNLRIGFLAKQVEEAMALACDVSLDGIRAANNRIGDLAAVALAARRGELHAIEARLFHPMEFMLAKTLAEVSDLPDPANYIIEDKFDGVRAQAHVASGRVVIYTRGLEETTAAFPELETALASLPGSAVVDGEILAWTAGRALAFTVLQQRLARKRISRRIAEDVPVAFVCYDLLYRDGVVLVDLPIEERRAHLETLLREHREPILLSPLYTARDEQELNRLFEESRTRGNEGLLLKRRGSLYESGKRSGAWHKLKRPFATLDVVITAAEQGSGRRATMLSDYTFAVRSDGEYVNVGKAYSGLTDPEVRELTRLLRSLATERFGRVVLVRPSVVLEVAFDGIQKSPRHKSGFALRFPRIVRWRKDKNPEDADDLVRVKELYDSSLNLTDARG